MKECTQVGALLTSCLSTIRSDRTATRIRNAECGKLCDFCRVHDARSPGVLDLPSNCITIQEGSVSDPTAMSIPHSSGANSDPDAATLESAVAPVGVSAPDLGSTGPYRLIRKLGEGGMGQVWVAEQSAPVKRQVALKIIKAGRYDDSAFVRFAVKRQTLAIMDRPAIAKVFDAASTARS